MGGFGNRIVRDTSLSNLLCEVSDLAVDRLEVANDISFVTFSLGLYDFAVLFASFVTSLKALRGEFFLLWDSQSTIIFVFCAFRSSTRKC